MFNNNWTNINQINQTGNQFYSSALDETRLGGMKSYAAFNFNFTSFYFILGTLGQRVWKPKNKNCYNDDHFQNKDYTKKEQ